MRSTEEIVESLRDALAGVGVVLPSLGVDPVTGASAEPFALVDLGRCNVRTAEHLTDVLRSLPVGEALRARVRQLNREGRCMS
ncbi:hypothetical protein ACIP4U_07840 [Streptomyces caelestis]|uniref:Uncharacterized protein n=1 Tax=Streptomyces caelestis TaxID=36816 RepID=A0A7W9H551_9ACTN|nr:hypothetical protein [Streptomyces caelestis]MBB5795661.1 hypothetical protein [Streptomyces caelestis]GGW61519.1 hypothetical protein GCM10010320_48340 [Streptomyces caelestis]